MTQESEKGHRSWWWALPAAAGVALVMVSVMLWPSPSSNPGVPVVHAQVTATATNTPTPAPTATVNPECDLSVSKSDSPTTVGEGGQITYTIKIENQGDENGDCTDLTVTDTIPTDTDCVSATDDGSLDFDIDGCDSSGDVVWDTNDNLADGEDVVVTMVVELTSNAEEDDTITNDEVCATSSDDVGGDCDTERTDVGAPATATPTTAPTATTRPTVQPVVPPPVAPPPIAPPPIAPPTALIAPMTGSGADGGSGTTQTLALTLGLMGAGLLLVSGVAFAKRTR